MTRLRTALLALFLFIPIQTAAQPITVGVVEQAPFAIRDATGVHSGLAVDLFRLAAERAGLDFRFAPVAGDPLAALAEHRVVLPVEGSTQAEARADLSHPMYTATLGYASQATTGPLNVVRGLLTWEFLRVILGVAGLLLLVGAIVWLIERRRNSEMFHKDAVHGLGDGFWWAGVTLTTIGYGDKAPVTFFGRAVAMFWMLTGLAVSASLTATVVTLADGGGGAPDLPEALADRSVVVVEDSPAGAFLAGRGVVSTAAASPAAALRLVAEEEVDVAVGTAPVLQWHDDREGLGLQIRTTRWDPVLITMAFPDGDPLRETMNRALLDVMTSEAGQEVVRRYLPDQG
ncbi:transporter substrate-binding domain-containing protein [Jannaschia sp. S6380]|uniref:ion channel n=1 Tax=Jannaschia sp. S6380 TaxID=2926408 RepID=UPI001FF32F79|nr:ion channel [Jannaschia sp. S6380]MCK0167785.1 transporter substrate-binding domain-containing protein [Jannaschia sp. S6380]